MLLFFMQRGALLFACIKLIILCDDRIAGALVVGRFIQLAIEATVTATVPVASVALAGWTGAARMACTNDDNGSQH